MTTASPDSQPRVLLVEDDPSLLRLLSAQLEDMGLDPIPVSSGTIAWQMIDEGLGFDLLISDVVLPGGMGGFELTRRAQERHPALKALLLSGYGRYAGVAPDGVDAVVLQKTTPVAEIEAKIKSLLATAPPEQA